MGGMGVGGDMGVTDMDGDTEGTMAWLGTWGAMEMDDEIEKTDGDTNWDSISATTVPPPSSRPW